MYDHFAMLGAVGLGGLTLLYAHLFWRTRQPWVAWCGAAFGLHALRFALHPWTLPIQGVVNPLAVYILAPAMVLMSVGVATYAHWSRQATLRLVALSVGLAVGVMGYTFWHGLSVKCSALWFSAFSLLYAVIALTEPAPANAVDRWLVCLAFVLFPVLVALSWWQHIDPVLLRYLAAFPTLMSGMTLLVVGLVRSQVGLQRALDGQTAARQALHELNANLEAKVLDRTTELQQLVDGLTAFSRHVSHDLRGPLTGMAGAAKVCLGALDAGDPDRARRFLTQIQAQAEDSTRLVGSLLALARMDQAGIHRQRVALQGLVDQVCEALAMQSPHWRADLQVLTAFTVPEVCADPDLLRQVLANLIGNAVKFSARVASPLVQIGSLLRDGQVWITVQDNGVGFDVAAGEQLFQPFSRLHGPEIEGAGVGLSIVRRIVERHGGVVQAKSKPGEGALFAFTLGPDAA